MKHGAPLPTDYFSALTARAVTLRKGIWLPTIVLLGFFWILIFNQQRLEWTVNVVYSYGWAVPFLALFLMMERWRNRPAAGRLPPAWLVVGAAATLLVAYLPVRIVQEANPDWVKVNWLMAGLCAGLSLLAFVAVGGARYAAHFVFPLVFCFSALPWPVWMETYLIQELMRWNAVISAEILTFVGIPAIAEGNLIQIGERWVNIEEACSGIRSLQTAFMMALFLGEFHRLAIARRIGLLVASFAVAAAVNVVRTILLTFLARSGDAAERWHDTIGVSAMMICLISLWGISEWFRPKAAPEVALPPPADARVRRPFPNWLVGAGCGWLVLAELMNQLWYTQHEKHVPPSTAWAVEWPVDAPNFQRGEFAERTLALLKYDRGQTASWLVDNRYPWQMYCLDWEPGRVSKFLSSSHYPTVCLPATGLHLVADLGLWNCEIDGLRFPFATYVFESGGKELYVFHAIIEARPLGPGEHFTYRQVNTTERLKSVWNGERNLGQNVIGIAFRGATSPTEAREIVQRVLHGIIRAKKPEADRLANSL